MAAGVLMPKAGISVESCIITEWLKQPGDAVAVGDILFSYETDKASFECECTEAGTLLERFFEDGDEVPVLVNVCAVGAPGEDVSALRPAGAEPGAAAVAQEAVPAGQARQAETVTTAQAVPGGEPRISPRARNLAQKQNVDPAGIAGTGPYGRIIERDIRTALEQGLGTAIGGRVGAADQADNVHGQIWMQQDAQDGPAYRDEVFSPIRKAISRSMTASLSGIPQLTHSFTFDATELLAYRAKLKAGAEDLGLPNITFNDMILFAVSRLLGAHPALNAHMPDGNTIRYFRDVNLGMAVDTERGLMVPVIRQADRKSLAQIAAEAKELARQAQSGSISPDDLSGGTFTISNLGTLGVEHFTPVINPPQTGILGVNNITQRPREVNGEIKLYPAMGISLTYDHRAVDGAPASRFANQLCRALEQFPLLLAR